MKVITLQEYEKIPTPDVMEDNRVDIICHNCDWHKVFSKEQFLFECIAPTKCPKCKQKFTLQESNTFGCRTSTCFLAIGENDAEHQHQIILGKDKPITKNINGDAL